VTCNVSAHLLSPCKSPAIIDSILTWIMTETSRVTRHTYITRHTSHLVAITVIQYAVTGFSVPKCPTLRVTPTISHGQTSHVTRHTSHVTRCTSHVTRHTSHVTRHTSHVTRHTLHVARHTSHVTRHTSHVTVTLHKPSITPNPSHVTRHTLPTSHVTWLLVAASSPAWYALALRP
jgi:hypothetical protein